MIIVSSRRISSASVSRMVSTSVRTGTAQASGSK
jgi:hypothetical protein